MNSLTEFIREKIELNLVNSGNCSIAMSGGQTPLNLYSNISESNIDWSKVDLSIVHERFVDLQSKHSNQNNILKSLALDIKDFKSFHGFDFTYVKDSKPIIKRKDYFYNLPFDLCLLGMGGDGHFASIFPNLTNLDYLLDQNTEELVSIVKTKEKIPYRLTLTYRAISQSKCIVVYITGKEKLSLIQRVMDNDVSPRDYPIKKIFNDFPNDLKIYWSP